MHWLGPKFNAFLIIKKSKCVIFQVLYNSAMNLRNKKNLLSFNHDDVLRQNIIVCPHQENPGCITFPFTCLQGAFLDTWHDDIIRLFKGIMKCFNVKCSLVLCTYWHYSYCEKSQTVFALFLYNYVITGAKRNSGNRTVRWVFDCMVVAGIRFFLHLV